jgi:hypothetical protein
MARRFIVVAALIAVVVASVPHAAGAARARAAGASWVRPVDGALTRPFAAPASRYGPGHRGVDLAAPPGTSVVAAGDGVIAFAGEVAGALHVVVAHAGGLKTGYSFLARVDVASGARVQRGTRIGVAGGAGDEHTSGVLHFSLRVNESYVDPMVLFAPPDLALIVHLAPAHGRDEGPVSPAREQRIIADGLAHPVALPSWAHDAQPHSDAERLVGAVVDAFGALGGAASGAAGAMAGVPRAVADGGDAALRAATELVTWAARRAGLLPVVRDVSAVARRLVDWARSRLHCTADAPDADGTGGSGHALMVVAGISSAWDGTGNSIGLPAAGLGYDPTEVRSFSYRGAGPYGDPDTWGDLLAAANRLAEQLRAMEREHPGREVDLVAHSQGGVVVDAFLQFVYRSDDRTYPPLGTVVTLSSPHQGAPLATAARQLAGSATGRAVIDHAGRAAGLPLDGALSPQQLAEGSPFLRSLWERRLPDHVDFTSIGGLDDYVVPATQIDVPGGRRVLVDPAGVADDHGAITQDRRAMRAVRLALEGRPPPCVPLAQGLRGAVEPLLVTRLEHGVGSGGAAIGRGVDALVP